MSLRVRLVDEAQLELQTQAAWYEARRPGLGIDFILSVDEACERLADWPAAGEVVFRLPEGTVRRMSIRRFPFYVVYVEAAEEARVLAIAHNRRSPAYWRGRV